MSDLDHIATHLAELRKRILRLVVIVGIITTLILTLHLNEFEYSGITLYYPTIEPLNNIAAQVTSYMKANLVPQEVQLIQTAPGQAFFSQVYIAVLIGITISIPIFVREAIGFIRPALKEREIHISRTITIPAVGLFITGCLFAYYTVIPYILDFLYKYGASANLVTFLNIMDFVSFVLQFLLAFGLSFQLPLVMYAITIAGITDEKFWKKNIRYAIVIIVIFGAVVTPDGSGVTMWFIAGPMILLYLCGIVAVNRHVNRETKDTKLNT
ncbi:MAG: twin-arginine translocase subunit TatC [Candidatus Nitrosoabyssus spongiisocia]|nr:MAG: twin-arginine translocase subunit TatC [Nitrosopumilaceae archaeon AB1(1)]